ncbi:MAG: hypothetical protein SPJ69_01500 [Campylobacter sp.]|uniref:hypothetical protein n=1 Tax=Campylobacter sp. TaxID=205 RepID=UPI0029765EC5|nr:hypothetical protein [Campylobacter sp.]MDD7600091.1 hypothetical protein [Campylobacteraceae bacterium]MDY5886975.1 hypothetical protein [Campylobacter sp.]
MSSPLWSSPRMTQGLGILDGILNEIASAFSKPRNDGILEFSVMSSPDQAGDDIVWNSRIPRLLL